MSISAAPSTAPKLSPPTRGFSTLEHEVVADALPLSGELPAWLSGSLLRTGPAKFEIGEQRMRHWFDGLAMLHRFTIDGGRVSYGNRFLESRSYRAAREQGRMVYGEFATDPCRSLFKRVQTHVLAGRRPAGQRERQHNEAGRAVRRDDRDAAAGAVRPTHAAAAGVRPYEVPGQLSTAHPHMDRASGGMLNYAAKLGAHSSYRFFASDRTSASPA